MKTIAMIPARLGSQRLRKKNLLLINNIPLISHTIRKIKEVNLFDEIWVNSENDVFGDIAQEEQVLFHKRPQELADNEATSEDFVYEFLCHHDCDYLYQIHSIAPLLTVDDILGVYELSLTKKYDIILGVVEDNLESFYEDKPLNFSFHSKNNSQELKTIKKVTWSITVWDREKYISTYEQGKCATYNGKIGFYNLNKISGIVIKTQEDFDLVEKILKK